MNRKTSGIAFHSDGHSERDLQVMVIKEMYRRDTILRKMCEKRSIGSSHPTGMNLILDSLSVNMLCIDVRTSHHTLSHVSLYLSFKHLLYTSPSPIGF